MSVSAAAGLKVQQSRFAVLKIESADSDSGGEEEWHTAGAGHGRAGRSPQKQGAHGATGTGSKTAAKNAKKRARRKRNQQSASSESPADHTGDAAVKGQSSGATPSSRLEDEHDPTWKHADKEAMDQMFVKNMEEAILQSTLQAEQEAELDKERQVAETVERSASKTGKGKKKVTLSLQQLHGLSEKDLSSPGAPDQISVEVAAGKDPASDAQFFSNVSASTLSELKRSQSHEHSGSSLGSPLAEDPESPRVAQLLDRVEKRETTIAELSKANRGLKKQLQEVKERNLSLCKILSLGELSSKAKLLQQVEDLSSIKNELTEELESLHSQLEQERSRNKQLSLELQRLQGNTGKGTKVSSH